MRHLFSTTAVVAAIVVAAAAAGSAQTRDRNSARAAGDAGCSERQHGNRASFCEVREATIGGANPLDIDAANNGGIQHPRLGPRRRARARASARQPRPKPTRSAWWPACTSRQRAAASAPKARRPTRDEKLERQLRRQVPRTAMLTLIPVNGGISIDGFHGSARFHATNGGVVAEQRRWRPARARRPTAA